MNITIIGCGAMGSALARHFAKGHRVLLCDSNAERRESLAKELGGKSFERLNEAVEEADVILLAVKPKDLSDIGLHLDPVLSDEQLLISVLAGTSLAQLHKHLPSCHLLRIMPNLALTCGQALIGLIDDGNLLPKYKELATELLDGLGLLTWIPESQAEAMTALGGSGPAFIFAIVEALTEGGVFMGFSADEAQEYVLKVMEGAIALIRKTGQHPAELKWKVASPAGTTIAGLNTFEVEGVRGGLIKTLLSAYERGLKI